MKQALAELYALQEMDLAIMRCAKQLRGLDTGAAEKQAYELAKHAHEEVAEQLRQAQGDLRDAELELASVETKQKEHSQLLYSGKVRNPKELEALQREVEALGRHRGTLDERVLNLMDRVETLVAEEQRLSKEEDRLREAYRSKAEAYVRAARKLRDELAHLQSMREAKAAEVPAALLKRYDAVRATKDGIGIAKLDGTRCGACRTILPRNTMLAVRDSSDIVTCESCGRLLCAC